MNVRKGQKGFLRIPAKDRFWLLVRKTDSCWNWCGNTDGRYGSFWYGGRLVKAHRFAYQIQIGPIPNGLQVLHRCDNPACVRPEHLFLGTQFDNMTDCAHKGRNGYAKLTPSLVSVIRKLWKEGKSIRSLANRYGVTRSCIERVIKRERWAHVV